MKKIKIYGAGGHSKVIMDIAESLGHTITKVYDDFPDQTSLNDGLEIQELSVDKETFFSDSEPMIVAIGDNHVRAKLANEMNSCFETLVHPTAVISRHAQLGEGTVVNVGGIVQAGSTIGRHVIINTGALVDHDNTIGDFVHISPNVSLAGQVTIGEGTHIGTGAIVIPKINVGKWCIVGAGAVIIRDVPDFAVVVGNPGRVIKYNK